MSDADRSRRATRCGTRLPDKWLVFTGDCQPLNEFLETKSDKSVFLVLQYANSLLRSFGQVLCANNPISGLIIVIAIASANYKAMFAALLTSSLSFFFAKFLQQDILGNLNGFFSYNAVLHAVVSVAYLPTLHQGISLEEPKFWLFLILTTLVSVYFTSALANLLRYLSQFPIPCFTLPFNLLQYILLFCLLNNTVPPKILSSHLLQPPLNSTRTAAVVIANQTSTRNDLYELENFRRKRNVTESIDDSDDHHKWPPFEEERNWSVRVADEGDMLKNDTHLNWGSTFSGTLAALSRVYGLDDVPCAVLMFLAVTIYSPTTAAFCYLGSLLGTLLGVSFASDFESVYSGVWGYNGLLSAGALAGFGFVLTPHSAFLALIAVLFCTAFQHFITPLFQKLDVPILHVPFIVTVFIFFLVTTEVERALPRPGILTYPEKHRQEFKERRKQYLEGYCHPVRGDRNGPSLSWKTPPNPDSNNFS